MSRAGGAGSDDQSCGFGKGLDVALGQGLGLFQIAGTPRRQAAAALLGWDMRPQAAVVEQTDGRGCN